jgi:hypothetical protein
VADIPFAPWWVKGKRTIAWLYCAALSMTAYGLMLEWIAEGIKPFHPWELLKGIAAGVLLRLVGSRERERLLDPK